MLSKLTSDLALTFSSLLVERVLAMVALFILVLLGLLVAPPGLPAILGYIAWAGLLFVALGSLVIMHPKSRLVINSLLAGDLVAPIRRRFTKLFNCLDTYANQGWTMIYSMGLAFGMQILRVE